MSNHLRLIRAGTHFTEWFQGDVHPARPGIYERDYWGRTGSCYSFWNGEFWCCGQGTVQAAAKMKHQRSCYQHYKWRGLLKEPKV